MKYKIKNNFGLVSCCDLVDLDLNYRFLHDGEDRSNDRLSRVTRFHIENNDYLGTTATVIDLSLQKGDIPKMRKVMKKIRDDLLHLQKNYKLVKRMTKIITNE